MISHIAQCKEIPEPIRNAIMGLQQEERFLPESSVYGSRKIFYDRVWSRLHEATEKVSDQAADAIENLKESDAIDTDNNKRKDLPDIAEDDPADVDAVPQPEEKKQKVEEMTTVSV